MEAVVDDIRQAECEMHTRARSERGKRQKIKWVFFGFFFFYFIFSAFWGLRGLGILGGEVGLECMYAMSFLSHRGLLIHFSKEHIHFRYSSSSPFYYHVPKSHKILISSDWDYVLHWLLHSDTAHIKQLRAYWQHTGNPATKYNHYSNKEKEERHVLGVTGRNRIFWNVLAYTSSLCYNYGRRAVSLEMMHG